MNYSSRLEIARHGFESVTLKLAQDYQRYKRVAEQPRHRDLRPPRHEDPRARPRAAREDHRLAARSSSRRPARCCASRTRPEAGQRPAPQPDRAGVLAAVDQSSVGAWRRGALDPSGDRLQRTPCAAAAARDSRRQLASRPGESSAALAGATASAPSSRRSSPARPSTRSAPGTSLAPYAAQRPPTRPSARAASSTRPRGSRGSARARADQPSVRRPPTRGRRPSAARRAAAPLERHPRRRRAPRASARRGRLALDRLDRAGAAVGARAATGRDHDAPGARPRSRGDRARRSRRARRLGVALGAPPASSPEVGATSATARARRSESA